MRVLVCGGRDYNDRDVAYRVLDDLRKHDAELMLMCGMATGADILAHQWAKYNRIRCLEFTADWNKHGKAAGPIRNAQMLEEGGPDLVIAFPGGRGTADMISKAKKAGVRVYEVGL